MTEPVPLAAASSTPPLGPVRAVLVVALSAVGVTFLAVGTVGLLRLPNVYNRLHATSKATTLGTASIALAAVARFGPGGVGFTALVTIVFLYGTAPTGGHVISRAAQRMGVPFVEGVGWPGAGAPPASPGGTETDEAGGTDGSGDG